MQYALNEKKSSRRENAENLRSILGEAMNRDRTEQDLFQSALGCTLESPFADMLAVKAQWRKLGGVEGYHLVQSFAPGEIAPEDVYKRQLFTFDATGLEGKSVVVFETLFQGETEIAGHEDIEDEGQTVTFVEGPKIGTTATVDGQHTAVPSGEVTIVDVVEYTGSVSYTHLSSAGCQKITSPV